MNTAPPPGFRPHTNRAALEKDFRSFLVNVREIRTLMTPLVASAPPVLGIDADRAFRDLLRLHGTETPPDGGDVVVDHRMMLDVRGGLAKIALKFAWTMPASYTMTIVLRLPSQQKWLLAALHAGGTFCAPAPLDPFKPALWLPFVPEELGPHAFFAIAALSTQVIRPRKVV